MEQDLHNTIIAFSREVSKLEGRKPGAELTLELRYKLSGYSEKRPTIILRAQFYNGTEHESVKATSLGTLMDEVYRRLGFSDKELMKNDALEASLLALPSPD